MDAKQPSKKDLASQKRKGRFPSQSPGQEDDAGSQKPVESEYSRMSPDQKGAVAKMYRGFYGIYEVLSEARAARESGNEEKAGALLSAVTYFAKETTDMGNFRDWLNKYETSSEPRLSECFQWLKQQKEMRDLRRHLLEKPGDSTASFRKNKALQLAGNPIDMYEEILFLVGDYKQPDKDQSYEQLSNFAKELPDKFTEHMNALLASNEPAVRETAMRFKESEAYKKLDVILRSHAQQPQLAEKPPKMKAF